MTNAERMEQVMNAEAAFYSWQPPGDPERAFRCHHTKTKHTMREEMCAARAKKPSLYQDDCGGGRPRCPRWKYYRKLARQINEHIQRKAYK